MRKIQTRRRRWGWFWTIATLYLILGALLSGCVDYEAGIRFSEANHGAIVQRVHLGDRFAALGETGAQVWLDDLQTRTQAAGGRVTARSPRDLTLEIPFYNGQELVTRFEQFFGSPTANPQPQRVPDLGSDRPQPAPPPQLALNAHLDLQQNNWLFAVRNRLHYDVDLRSIGMVTADESVLLGTGSLVDLAFALDVPWGARALVGAGAIAPHQYDGKLVWRLQPGQVNALDAVFWVPSGVGIGTVAIALLVALGWWWRDRVAPVPD